MNILITGGAGFVGSNLCHKLLAQKHKVIAVDNFITSTKDNIEDLLEDENFEFCELDVTTSEFKDKFMKARQQIDQVYHLACPTGVTHLIPLAEEMIDTCSVGTKQVLQIASKHQAGVVVTSTAEVYGNPEIFPQIESYNGNVSPTGERSAYEEGKRFTEATVAMFVRKYKLDAKIARLFNAYGPRMLLKDPRVHPNMIRQVLNGSPLIVYGDGSQTRTFCFVDDTVSGLVSIMNKGQAGEVYNVGSDQQIRIEDLAKKIVKLMGSTAGIEYQAHFIHDHQGRQPAVEKLKALGWKRTIDLDEGTQKTIDYFRRRMSIGRG